MNLNDNVEVEITSLDHQGRGIGRIGDKIIFISNSLPGEIVETKITIVKKNYLEGEVIRYIKTSDKRIKPLCPYYDECGGCDLMHISYDEQAKYKEDKVRNIMNRYASIDCVDEIVKCDNPLNYRNKVTIQVKSVIGMYKKKSYDIIPIDKCLLVDERINNYLKILKKMNLDYINQIVIRTSYDDEMIIFNCEKDININVDMLDCNVIKKYKDNYTTLRGNNYIIDIIGDKRYKISPSSFFQVNSNQVKKLYDKVVEYLNLNGNESILDLYCGTGTIGIYLADKVKEVLGVEINKDAILDAEINAKMNNIINARFIAGDASKIVKDLKFKPDKIVVDPPRSGLEKNVINKIVEMNPKVVVYVSCDPVTLARDLNLFKEKYTVKNVTPVDMFCNTMHVECVTLLCRKNL